MNFSTEEQGILLLQPVELGGVDTKKIRQVILDPDHTQYGGDAKTELLLCYIAGVAGQHLVNVSYSPAAGKVVLMDRFIDSSVAYQGYGRGLECGRYRMAQSIRHDDGLNQISPLL